MTVSNHSIVESPSGLGEGVSIWHFSHLRADVLIGSFTTIGKSVYIGPGVKIGSNCKIQNSAQIYEPAVIEDGVFIGPGVILTNDLCPRAINSSGELLKESDWSKVKVYIDHGASIGAGSICVAPVKIGKWAMVAAGAVVIQDVPDYALVAGVPAKQIGWVDESGKKLFSESMNKYVSRESSEIFCEINGELKKESLN